ncbi:hypothetical protein SUGI_0369720 [Cryptomeria japonica]|nr:hypothetical protein SUGI_0369720 [Cryptomeria japonica]
MGNDSDPIQACRELLDNVKCLGKSSPYKPFGIYMICSTQGAACIEDSQAALEMLILTLQSTEENGIADALISEHKSYGDKDLGEKKGFHINWNRMNLEDFWDKIIDMVKNQQLPSDFRYQNKWINAGIAYRRLVEPLDIVDFYHLHSDRGSYLSIKNRPLQEANKDLTNLQLEKEQTVIAHLKKSLKDFEAYVSKMIEEKSISMEVFFEESGFMIWWKKYREFQQQHSEEWDQAPLCSNPWKRRNWEFKRQVFDSVL